MNTNLQSYLVEVFKNPIFAIRAFYDLFLLLRSSPLGVKFAIAINIMIKETFTALEKVHTYLHMYTKGEHLRLM
jgi:hypothetical protein